MRISIIGSRGFPLVYSGYETFVSELAPRLAIRGHEVCVYSHRGLFRHRPMEVSGVKLIYLPSVETKNLSQFSHSLLSTFHVLFSRTDVVFYVNSANGPFALFTKLAGKNSVINVDGLEWMRPKWKGLGAKYFYFASWLATKLFDVIVTDSLQMAEIYRKEFGVESVTIAYGAVPAGSKHAEKLHQLALTRRSYYLVVGRLIPDNNVQLMVKAFEKSTTKRKLVVVGDVPYADKYARMVRETKDPRIVFPGYIKDADLLRELYCNSYAYLHGHEFGGTNPALLKALAYSCCILALDTVFSREVLNDGEFGLFFKKDVHILTELIDRLDTDHSVVEALRAKAQRRILENYTWEKITDQYESLFKELSKT